MADGIADVMGEGTPLPPSAGKAGKRRASQRKTRARRHGEGMARLWAEGDTTGLGLLCGELGQKHQIEAVAAEALDLLPPPEGEELMGWLRWRTTWEDEQQGDGFKLCCDMFALPLRGPRHHVDGFIGGGRLCELLVEALRSSGIASPTSEFVFVPIALPLMTAACLTLDGVSALRSGMMNASMGEDGLETVSHELLRLLPEAEREEEAVLLGMRLVRMRQEDEPQDIFRAGLAETVSARSLKQWGEVSGELSKKIGLFVGIPQDVPDAVAFLSAVRANHMLDVHPAGPRHDYVVHACRVEDGILLSRCDGSSIAGPVLVPTALAYSCEEMLMDGVSEHALDVAWHSKPAHMPGVLRERSPLN